MIDPQVARVVLAVYSALLAAGGIMGYVKAGSRPSLVAGLISGLVGVAAVVLAGSGRGGLYLGAGLAAGMAVVFGWRFSKTRKFMPSGMLAVVSIIVWGVVALSVT